MMTRPQRRNLRLDGLFLVLAALLVGLYVMASGGGFPLDDSWIHQTFARNLAQHGEWSFVVGQPSAASTSPLYTVVLSLGYALGVPYALWTHGLGVLALAGMAMLGARLARHIAPDMKRAPLMVGLALLLTWHLIWAAASGMETALFGLLTLALILVAWQRPFHEPSLNNTVLPASSSRNQRAIVWHGALVGVLVALTTLARPEGAMLGGFIAVLMVLVRPQGSWGRLILWAVSAAVGFGVFIAPYLLLNLSLTGGLLPDTAAAKFNQHEILLTLPYSTRIWRMSIQIMAGGQILLLPGVVAFVLMVGQRVQKNRAALFYSLPVLWAVGLLMLYAARLPAAYQHGRYVIPALPALVVMGVIGTMLLLQWAYRRRLWRIITRAWALSAAAVFVVFAFSTGVQVYRVDVGIINQEMVATAHWIRDNIAPDELLAIHDVGAVGYFAPRDALLDIAGLVTPDVIPIVADPPALWQLMQARDARYLMAFPDQIPGRDPDDPRLCRVFITNGAISRNVGGPNMAVYRLAWDGVCDEA